MDITMIDLLTTPLPPKSTVRETAFYVASARARNIRVIKLLHPSDTNTVTLLCRELRKLRNRGRIVCFSRSGALEEMEAQALYILDKVPALDEDRDFHEKNENVLYILLS